MKIRNFSVLALLAVFLIVGLIAVPLADYPWRVLHIVVVLVISFVLSAGGLLGAGDAKFVAVMAAFVPFADMPSFMMLLATVMIAALATHRAFRAMPGFRARTADWQSWSVRKFPLGFAFGGALAFYLVLGAILGA